MLQTSTSDILLLRTYKGTQLVPAGDITRVEAISNYCRVYFSNGQKLVVAKLLRWFEEQLPAGQFIRIHRKHIVNKNSVQRYVKGKTVLVRLEDGEQIMVAKRKKSYFLRCWIDAA